MTRPEQLGQDGFDLGLVVTLVLLGLAAVTWWAERRARRRHEPEVLPPPVDGRDHNEESIAEWKRKRDAIARTQ